MACWNDKFFFTVNCLWLSMSTTILSQASAHPPTLTVLCFFEVLHVTTHHAKFLRKGRSLRSLTQLWSFWCASGTTTPGIKGTHTPVRGLVHNILRLQPKIRLLQAMNAVETWQQDYRSAHFVARYSFLHHWPGLDKAWAKWQCKSIWYLLAANFASGVGPCGGIVEPFKHLLCRCNERLHVNTNRYVRHSRVHLFSFYWCRPTYCSANLIVPSLMEIWRQLV